MAAVGVEGAATGACDTSSEKSGRIARRRLAVMEGSSEGGAYIEALTTLCDVLGYVQNGLMRALGLLAEASLRRSKEGAKKDCSPGRIVERCRRKGLLLASAREDDTISLPGPMRSLAETSWLMGGASECSGRREQRVGFTHNCQSRSA